MIKKGFSYMGIFFLYLIALLPMPLLYCLSTALYHFVYHITGYRKNVVRDNLERSFPGKSTTEIEVIEKRFYRFLCDLIFEIIKMPLISKAELEKRCKFTNLHHIEALLASKKSVIVCSSHYGNWEWGMLAFGIKVSSPKLVVYKPLHSPAFDIWFHKMRSRFGNTMVSMKQTLRVLASSRNIPSVLCLASDQTPETDQAKYWIDFLHQPTAVYTGPEKIAVQTDRAIFYIQVRILKRGYYELDCVLLSEEPKKTAEYEITKKQFKLLTESILAEPQYWLWSHKRWKHKQQSA